jgi:HEAT repeat protein
MPALPDRLKLLRREPLRARAAILAGALPHADRVERGPLWQAALATGHPTALAAAIGLLHRLGSAGLRDMCGLEGSLEPAVRLVRCRGPRQAMLNAIAVAGRRGDLDLLPHLVAMLSASNEDIQRQAGEAVLAVVIQHAGLDGRRLRDPAAARAIDGIVAAAAMPQRRRRPGPALRRVLADPDHPALFALRGAVGRTSRHAVRVNLLRWIAHPVLGGQAQRCLHRVRGTHWLADLLEPGHLLLSPPRRRALRRVDRPVQLLPDLTTAAALPEPVQSGLVRLIRALPLPASDRRERLADCIALSSPIARLRALEGLLGDGTAAAVPLIEKFCLDHEPPVALVASRRALRAAGADRTAVFERIELSPHRAVARRAGVIAAGRTAADFFDRWLLLESADRRAAGLQLLRAHREAFLAGLAEFVSAGERPERLAAIALARRLRVVNDLEDRLIAQLGSADRQVVSAAVAALGDGGPGRGATAVRKALGHADPRVRANAVEALVRIDRRPGAHLDALAASRDNRLRANAVRGLLIGRAAGGVRLLRRMLADDDPRHRVSAVWVARSARALPVTTDLRRMADEDRFTEIRRRASAAARLLEFKPHVGGREVVTS